jgi:hypothetical protein
MYKVLARAYFAGSVGRFGYIKSFPGIKSLTVVLAFTMPTSTSKLSVAHLTVLIPMETQD